MNILQVQITVEPFTYFAPVPPHRVLRIRIKRFPGEDLYLEKVVPDDDLLSLWDYLWEESGRLLRETMERGNK